MPGGQQIRGVRIGRRLANMRRVCALQTPRHARQHGPPPVGTVPLPAVKNCMSSDHSHAHMNPRTAARGPDRRRGLVEHAPTAFSLQEVVSEKSFESGPLVPGQYNAERTIDANAYYYLISARVGFARFSLLEALGVYGHQFRWSAYGHDRSSSPLSGISFTEFK